jgi:hypothetical protein
VAAPVEQVEAIAPDTPQPVADFALPGRYDRYGTLLEIEEDGSFRITGGEEICGLSGEGTWTQTREVEMYRNADLVLDGQTLVLIQDRMSKSGVGLNCPEIQNPYEPDLYLERQW